MKYLIILVLFCVGCGKDGGGNNAPTSGDYDDSEFDYDYAFAARHSSCQKTWVTNPSLGQSARALLSQYESVESPGYVPVSQCWVETIRNGQVLRTDPCVNGENQLSFYQSGGMCVTAPAICDQETLTSPVGCQ